MALQGSPSTPHPFDPAERDCFARFINRTDAEVTALIITVKALVNAQGEYDQDDQIRLPFDEAMDLVTVAEKLWAWVRGEI